jgi:hypothetical protein
VWCPCRDAAGLPPAGRAPSVVLSGTALEGPPHLRSPRSRGCGLVSYRSVSCLSRPTSDRPDTWGAPHQTGWHWGEYGGHQRNRTAARTFHLQARARSSAGERSLHTREVAGSKPAVPIRRKPRTSGVFAFRGRVSGPTRSAGLPGSRPIASHSAGCAVGFRPKRECGAPGRWLCLLRSLRGLADNPR